MKQVLFQSLTLIAFTLNSVSVLAYNLTAQEVCVDPVSVSGYELICDNGLSTLLAKGNTRVKIKNLPFEPYYYTSFGFPDDSTHQVYDYFHRIESKQNGILGYAHYFGLSNSESQTFFKVSVYYSLKGDVLGAFVE